MNEIWILVTTRGDPGESLGLTGESVVSEECRYMRQDGRKNVLERERQSVLAMGRVVGINVGSLNVERTWGAT